MTTPGGLEEVESLMAAGDHAAAEQRLRDLLARADENEASTRIHEQALVKLGALLRDQGRADDIAQLIRDARPFVAKFARSKTAKLVRTLIDDIRAIPDTLSKQVEVTKELIEWAVSEKRVFLRQSLETRLIGLYVDTASYQPAIALIDTLLRELKKLDDKLQLVEVHLLESRVYHLLRNMAKSRAALTAAKTAGNSVYCPPLLQASLDNQSGILHAEEKDYETAYSYFYEAMEGFAAQDDERASQVVKYMLLSKIMLNSTDDVHSILSGKLATKYAGRNLDAMKAVAQAHKNRSLAEFETALDGHKAELGQDPIIRAHFSSLYDTLLEQNLVRVIEPFSRVEIAHVAKAVGLSAAQVEGKLSQMVLDKVVHGVIDQGTGTLVIYDEPEEDKTYNAALETIKHMSAVVDLLYEKAIREQKADHGALLANGSQKDAEKKADKPVPASA